MNTVAFDNGLTPGQRDELGNLRIEVTNLSLRVEALGRHRSLSLAITKLDEAGHWLRDRLHRAA